MVLVPRAVHIAMPKRGSATDLSEVPVMDGHPEWAPPEVKAAFDKEPMSPKANKLIVSSHPDHREPYKFPEAMGRGRKSARRKGERSRSAKACEDALPVKAKATAKPAAVAPATPSPKRPPDRATPRQTTLHQFAKQVKVRKISEPARKPRRTSLEDLFRRVARPNPSGPSHRIERAELFRAGNNTS